MTHTKKKSNMLGRYRQGGYVLSLLIITLTITGCFFKGKNIIVPDGNYFQKKSRTLVTDLFKTSPEGQNDRIVIIDPVNSSGKVSLLGRYFSFKIYESMLHATNLSLVPRGEVLKTMKDEGIKITSDFSDEDLKKISSLLEADTFIMGEIIDLGIKIEVNMKMIDAHTGELISAASQDLERQDTVVTLFESF